MRRLASTLAGRRSFAGRGGNRNERARKPGLSEIEAEIAGLLDRSTPELRLTWHEFRRAGPPLGLSRDLLIRALAYELQQRVHGRPSSRYGAVCRAWSERQRKPRWPLIRVSC